MAILIKEIMNDQAMNIAEKCMCTFQFHLTIGQNKLCDTSDLLHHTIFLFYTVAKTCGLS